MVADSRRRETTSMIEGEGSHSDISLIAGEGSHVRCQLQKGVKTADGESSSLIVAGEMRQLKLLKVTDCR